MITINFFKDGPAWRGAVSFSPVLRTAAHVRLLPIAEFALGRLTINRPPTEAAYLYLTTKVALLFAVLEVGHRLQLVLRCVKNRVIRIIAISIFRL